jgi:hypothetical protein
MRSLRIVIGGLLAAAPVLPAQDAERLRMSAITESYSFGSGYPIRSMSQTTLPVTLDVSLGRRASLVLSTGFMSVSLRGVDSTGTFALDQNTPLDTELRLDVSVVPQRLVAFLAGTVPTSRQTIEESDLSILVGLTNDAVGFSVPTFGSGGNVATGFSAAVPVGSFALGVAATGVYSFAYQPVVSRPAELQPGAEARLRLGIEGPLSTRTYLRTAASLVMRQRDELDGFAGHTLGRRLITYVSVEQGLGPAMLGLYVFDVFRGTPQLEPTAAGVAVLPRGNLLVAGSNIALVLGRHTSLVPGIEYRVSTAAATAESTELLRQSSSFRASAELRHRLRAPLTLIVRGEGALGEAVDGATYYDMRGYRASVRLELTP